MGREQSRGKRSHFQIQPAYVPSARATTIIHRFVIASSYYELGLVLLGLRIRRVLFKDIKWTHEFKSVDRFQSCKQKKGLSKSPALLNILQDI